MSCLCAGNPKWELGRTWPGGNVHIYIYKCVCEYTYKYIYMWILRIVIFIHIYIYTGCTCSNIQGWLAEESKGFDRMWMCIGRKVNTSLQVVNPNVEAILFGIGYAWVTTNIHKHTKCPCSPTVAQNEKKSVTIPAVRVVWHESLKISKPSVCGAMQPASQKQI